MRIGLIGAVNSTRVTLEALIRHDMDIALVMGYEPTNAKNVSAYADLSKIAKHQGLNYKGFKQINQHVDDIAAANLDVLFVVGFSQLVCQEIIDLPTIGAVGFHPTALPRGRGRAPIAWMVMNQEDGAACFFALAKEPDVGPVFVRQDFEVTANDDAGTVEEKLLAAMSTALDSWLPELKQGIWDPEPQDHTQATEYGVRKPDDGLIDFSWSAQRIDRVVKAATHPHPGAFTYYRHNPFVVLQSDIEADLNIQGSPGRVLKVVDNRILVQCGSGLIWLYLTDGQPKPGVGERLGFLEQVEIHNLYNELQRIKQKLGIDE